MAHLWSALVGPVGVCVCGGGGGGVPGALGPSGGGQGGPTLRPLGGSVGRVPCGLLQPTTAAPEGVRGVAWTHGLLLSLTDPVQSTRAQVALQRVLDQRDGRVGGEGVAGN